MIKVGIVDDHKIFLNSLVSFISSIPDMEVVLIASSGEEFISIINKDPELSVDVMLLDIKMKGLSGLDCLDYINEANLDWKTIILSMYDHSSFIHQAIQKGAMSFINKEDEPELLIKAIYKVYDQGFYINQSLSKILVNKLDEKQKASIILHPKEAITKTEFEILQLICLGHTAGEIGDLLHRSKRTIEGHRQHLLEKTDTKNAAELVAWAFREGLLS